MTPTEAWDTINGKQEDDHHVDDATGEIMDDQPLTLTADAILLVRTGRSRSVTADDGRWGGAHVPQTPRQRAEDRPNSLPLG